MVGILSKSFSDDDLTINEGLMTGIVSLGEVDCDLIAHSISWGKLSSWILSLLIEAKLLSMKSFSFFLVS